MKKLILTLFFICYGFLSIAQDNPYEVFGYKTKNIFEDKTEKFTIINSDTTSIIKRLLFDAEKRQIEFLNEKGEVINRMIISEEQLFRFMAIDQLASKWNMVSPYGYALNNPIKYIDPDGRDNVIYLVNSDNSLTKQQLAAIRNEANAIFKKAGVNTRVAIYKGKSSIDVSKLDKTDGIAIVGKNEKQMANYVKKNISEKFYDTDLAGKYGTWVSDEKYPETSNRNGDATDIDINLVVTSYNRAFKRYGSQEKFVGFTIAHGAGHNTGFNHPGGIMVDGNVLAYGEAKKLEELWNPNVQIDKMQKEIMQALLNNYRKAMIKHFGDKTSKENYPYEK